MRNDQIDPKSKKYLAIVPIFFLICSCTLQNHKSVPELSNKTGTARTAKSKNLDQLGSTQEGQASVYADKFEGRKTASGASFDQNELTAASKEHAFGSKLKVTNKKSGKCTIVTVTDRGPYSKGRIIDLSKAAAEQIEMPIDGVTNVVVEKVD